MKLIDNLLNIIMLTLLFSVSFVVIASAQTAQSAQVQWLWPVQSVAVSQSTTALVLGHHGRAIRMAERALARTEGHDRVVALHNLCIAYLRSGELTSAIPQCNSALSAAGAGAQQGSGQSTFAIVKANIDRERGFNTQATEVARSDQ
jgi:hypothetical protein